MDSTLVFISFLALSLLFFLQYPLNKSLIGDLDSIATLAIYKHIKCIIICFFTDGSCGTFNYPTPHPIVAFGFDTGLVGLYMLLELLKFDDLWTYWLFISLIFALNAWCLFMMSNALFGSKYIGFLSGLLFTFSQFTLGNIENPNAIFFPLLFISLLYLVQYLKQPQNSYWLAFVLSGTIQIYFNPSAFVLWAIISFIVLMYSRFYIHALLPEFVALIQSLILALVIISPYLYFFVFSDYLYNYYNPVNVNTIWMLSLSIDDFSRALPGNLLYQEGIFLGSYFSQIKSACLGLGFWCSSLIGLFYLRKKVTILIIILMIVGIILSFGPAITYKTKEVIKTPLWIFYTYMDGSELFRIPVRFFFITVACLSIVSASLLGRLYEKRGVYKIAALTIMTLILIENVPFVMKKYNHEDIFHNMPELTKLAEEIPGTKQVLHLPSYLFIDDGDKLEYIYTYWQHIHKQKILNGGSAFFSPERMRNDKLAKGVFEQGNLTSLINANNIDYILFHKNFGALEKGLNMLDSRVFVISEREEVILYGVDN